MKRILYLLSVLLMLSGCARNPVETAMPVTTVPVTEPPVPWIHQNGTDWDREGNLRQLHLTVPDGIQFNNALEFDGDLLLWSIDNHLRDVYTLELCLMELDTGTVTASRELVCSEYVDPQVLGQTLYICDQTEDRILSLNTSLQTEKQWDAGEWEGTFVMGADETLYIYDWNGNVTRLDLKTGETAPLMPDCYIDYFTAREDYASIQYLEPDTGAAQHILMDLHTGDFLEPPRQNNYSDLFYSQGTWLCESYRYGNISYVGTSGEDFRSASLGSDMLKLLDGNTLLLTSEEGCAMSIHDITGKALARAILTEQPYSYNCIDVIPSDAFGGYFLLLNDYSGSLRLLYWDIYQGEPGNDIPFAPISKPDEAEAAVRSRAQELSNHYGLNILVGTDCGTVFFDFSAEQVTDWEAVDYALDVLENALDDYPEGFFRQLRYGDIRRTEIHLAGTLTATNGEYTDSYEAFVQDNYDCHVMVADITLADEGTYYHEFSHVIDSFLEWDAMNREDAVFSEETWCDFNPHWFPGYTYDYSREELVQDYSCFVDSYSTINPTEDRARVLEYAMADYGTWTFEGCEVLTNKLDYYCRCIRDAFDTTGWPETVFWEQYLP